MWNTTKTKNKYCDVCKKGVPTNIHTWKKQPCCSICLNETKGGEMNDYLYNLCDELDAALFTGDCLEDAETKEEIKNYLKRWSKRIIETEEKETIKQFLDLSTIHLKQSDVKLLEGDRIRNMTTYPTDYGFKVYVYTDESITEANINDHLKSAGYSDNFIKIVKYSLEKECVFINFDRDAEQCELFEVYEDEWE